MLKKNKTINVNGRSMVAVDGTETVAMTMNATINEDGSISTNKYIQNKEVYFSNQESADADAAEFEAYVKKLAEV